MKSLTDGGKQNPQTKDWVSIKSSIKRWLWEDWVQTREYSQSFKSLKNTENAGPTAWISKLIMYIHWRFREQEECGCWDKAFIRRESGINAKLGGGWDLSSHNSSHCSALWHWTKGKRVQVMTSSILFRWDKKAKRRPIESCWHWKIIQLVQIRLLVGEEEQDEGAESATSNEAGWNGLIKPWCRWQEMWEMAAMLFALRYKQLHRFNRWNEDILGSD